MSESLPGMCLVIFLHIEGWVLFLFYSRTINHEIPSPHGEFVLGDVLPDTIEKMETYYGYI